MSLNKIGEINISNIRYIDRNNKLFLRSKLELNIDNQDEFYKRFQVSRANRINLSKIYFIIEKNIDENEYYLGKIYFNDFPKINNNEADTETNFNQIVNFQTLTKLIKSELKQINLD